MWLWAAITKGAGLHHRQVAGAAVARRLLGTDRRKVVISDRFKGYARVKRRQFCRADLRRDFRAMIDRVLPGSCRPTNKTTSMAYP
jgi:acid stress-induced BolA-like protein IbaG/YrbA